MSEIELLLNKAQTSLNLGNPKEALSFYQKILDQDPKNLTALLKKGNIFGKFGKFNDAILCYDGVILQEKQNILALLKFQNKKPKTATPNTIKCASPNIKNPAIPKNTNSLPT